MIIGWNSMIESIMIYMYVYHDIHDIMIHMYVYHGRVYDRLTDRLSVNSQIT